MASLPSLLRVDVAPSTALATALALLCTWPVLQTLVQWYRLSHVPGPFWAAFSKYWMVKESLKGRQPTAIKEANDRYGNIFPNARSPQNATSLLVGGVHDVVTSMEHGSLTRLT
jgi:hypothetical protein